MCDPVSIGTAIVGIAASQALAPKPPKMQEPPAPAAPPQAAKMPEQQAVRAAASGAGATAAPQSTMLTGMGGVAPGALNLGKSTLLGQ
jgi:hypothetical protein